MDRQRILRDLQSLITEQRNPATRDIDLVDLERRQQIKASNRIDKERLP